MKLELDERRISLGVGEFAAFGDAGRAAGRKQTPFSQWRMEAGRIWHSLENAEYEKDSARATETAIEGKWQHRGWSFLFRGRVDQVEQSDHAGTKIRELKTVREALPVTEDEVLCRFSNYITQLATYVSLAEVQGVTFSLPVSGTLVLIDIDTGIRQERCLNADEVAEAFERRLDRWVDFLEERARSRVRRQKVTIRPAFSEMRCGQGDLLEALRAEPPDGVPVLLQAPTGFGKTGIILEYALHALKENQVDRLIYLTGKSSGQIGVVEQLRRMTGNGLNVLHMRNRKEHAEGCFCRNAAGGNSCIEMDAENNALEGGEDEGLEGFKASNFEEGFFGLETSWRIAAEHHQCPYRVTVQALPFAEVWVADYNYVFSPGTAGVWAELPDYVPGRTLLIVDEAHTLADRAADALSVRFSESAVRELVAELRDAGVARPVLAAVHGLMEWVSEVAIGPLSTSAAYELVDLLEEVVETLEGARLPWRDFSAGSTEVCFGFVRALEIVRSGEVESRWLLWSSRSGEVALSCLDASDAVRETLLSFRKSVLMSATLFPEEPTAAELGLAGRNYRWLVGRADWREQAYRVAVDCRVDTRLKQRDKYFAETARTVALAAAAAEPRPVVVFFPSFQYADSVKTYLEVVDPGIRCGLQPRGVGLAEQQQFIEEACFLFDALFLVLGSSYAEGIDSLGGKVDQVIVVSPAVAEVNALQEAKRAQAESGERNQEADAFQRIYQLPGLKKIQQALGRVVRGPGQRASVLLHCRRFEDPKIAGWMDPVLRPQAKLRNQHDLERWYFEKEATTMTSD